MPTHAPWNLVGRVLAHVQSQQAQVVLVAPVWKTQPWYPLLLSMLGQCPHLINQGPEVIVHQTQPVLDTQEHLRQRYREQELSENATSLMLKSWRARTNRAYDSLFTRWNHWCGERDEDPFSGPITNDLWSISWPPSTVRDTNTLNQLLQVSHLIGA